MNKSCMYKLKDILIIRNGGDYRSLNCGDIPVYGTGGLMTYVDSFVYDGESILLPRKGSLNNIMYVNGKFWTVDTMYWTEVDTSKVYTQYLYYFLTLLDLSSRNSGSTLPSMTFDAYYDIDVSIPPLDIQQKILGALYPIERKISINNQINDNLEQQLKLLYDYWFLQFDFPDENGKPYKSSGGKMVWNKKLKREIPENWFVESLTSNRLSSIISPGVDVFDFKNYLATADVQGTNISGGNIINFNNRENRANMQPTVNSVWFAKMKNSIKHIFLGKYMKPIIDESILSTGFLGLQCTEKSFEYLSSYIASPYFEMRKNMLAHGATQEAVNNSDLDFIKLIIPDERVLELYHNITSPFYNEIGNNICENRKLIALRDFLLPLLMNGQATITD